MMNWVDELNQIILKIRLYTEPVLKIILWTLLETDPNPIYESKTKIIYYAKREDERFIKFYHRARLIELKFLIY